MILCLGLTFTTPALALPAGQSLASDPALARNIPLLRKACYLKVSPIWEAGATGPVIQANQAYRDCLLDISVKVLNQYYSIDMFKPLSPRQFLEKQLESVSNLAYTVQTNLKVCLPNCGTMWQMVASGQEGAYLEDLLRDMADRILLETDESLLTDQAIWKKCWESPSTCPAKF